MELIKDLKNCKKMYTNNRIDEELKNKIYG